MIPYRIENVVRFFDLDFDFMHVAVVVMYQNKKVTTVFFGTTMNESVF